MLQTVCIYQIYLLCFATQFATFKILPTESDRFFARNARSSSKVTVSGRQPDPWDTKSPKSSFSVDNRRWTEKVMTR